MKTSHSRKLAFLKTWQRKLRLQDWDIKWMEKSFKKHSGKVGETAKLSLHMMSATLRTKKGLGWKEFQRTALHEMLHVRFASCSMEFGSDDSAKDLNMEQAIEIVMRALLKEKGK